MAMPVELDPRAEEEARAAFLWYFQRSERAAIAFEVELATAIEQISKSPETYPIVENSLRRFTLDRFPYSVLYTIAPTTVLVIAVAHQHRRPGYWLGR